MANFPKGFSEGKTRMLNLKSVMINFLLLLALTFLVGCIPSTTAPGVQTSNTTNGSGTTVFNEPTYPLSGLFLQESSRQTNNDLSLPLNFSDSFLLRGNSLSLQLKKLPANTVVCLVAKFSYSPSNPRFLILAARTKIITDTTNKTTEALLSVSPGNFEANQSDCLTYNLTNTLFQNQTNPSAHFSLEDLCTNCASGSQSSVLKLYYQNGEVVSTLDYGNLTLSLTGNSNSTSNSCVENTSCMAQGFNCCLDGQCVKDGAMRSGTSNLPGYAAAMEDVKNNPARFILYPQFFFVCATRPDNTGTNPPSTGTTNPDYEREQRVLELSQLFECLNKTDEEFSYCTVKITNASKANPKTFSLSALGITDDINFSNVNPQLSSGDFKNNITKIRYAGEILYQQNSVSLPGFSFVTDTANDDLVKGQAMNLSKILPTNAVDDLLYLTYKVDGTCERVNSTTAKCLKTYIYQSDQPTSTFWQDGSRVFKLPLYADTSSSANIIVRIGGLVVPEDPTTWQRAMNPPRIEFNPGYQLFSKQKIEISYFVTSNASALLSSKNLAQSKVDSLCKCQSGQKCNLTPVKDANNNIINYQCVLGTVTSTTPPANQTVLVSNKNTPHRFYDINGVNYDENYQSAPNQELSEFTYLSNNTLKPNNVSGYVGFNEIYGSYSKTNLNAAKPAKLVRVKKDMLYDISVSNGSFSSCATCGNDYYSSLQKIFPSNFSGMAGGYSPDLYESRRENNTSIYRADDLIYGRACFLPVTMIPWTHLASNSVAVQRRQRLAAQHFLFANGYQKDWYGFDYGSLIGSFDGVKWFSIGNLRRIKASTDKLYLAVNAYFGDLSVDTNFSVNINETSVFSSLIPEHDTDTDGAECQRAHFCSNDNDCFKQLGFEYTCQNVSSLTTNWPQFDGTGNETIGTSQRSILSLVGGSNGQNKRCVYRGKGTPCLANLLAAGQVSSYNGSNLYGHLGCSHNNVCTSLNENRFNDRISRFAQSPVNQNLSQASPTPSDTVGLAARIIGRPFDYYGTQPTPVNAKTTLVANKVDAICIPGRDISNSTQNLELNSRVPGNRIESSDKLFGVGPTQSTSQSIKALNSCPAVDANGNSLQLFDLPLGDSTLNMFTISQNLSSNLLNLNPLLNLNIYSVIGANQVTTIGYQKNTCLKAAGAACVTDMECAPSTHIANKAKAADLTSILNSAEEKFWEEELVCGNPDFKTLNDGSKNPSFDIKKNACCRETGKLISVQTQSASTTFKWCDQTTNQVRVAGVNIPINTTNRYSRVHTAFDKMTCNVNEMGLNKTFALSLEASSPSQRFRQIFQQYKTLDTVNQRTCCTKNWIRSFAVENGGGNKFARTKMQNIDKSMFKHISWAPENNTIPGVSDEPFECDENNFANASCEIKNITPSDETKYLEWAASLELIGIPQVAIKSNDEIFKMVDDNQLDSAALKNPLNKSILDVNAVGEDFTDGTGKRLYSAASYNKFSMGVGEIKKVFSENEFKCCQPAGIEVTQSTSPDQCCTGNISTTGGPRRCCLPDFTDLTVYLNRYVSSEGRGLPDNAYDPYTGYIKDPAQVKIIANQKNLCCSGSVMTGVAISKLPIPLNDGKFKNEQNSVTRRFNYRSDAVDNNPESGSIGSIFDSGVRWNNHVYCVPEGFGEN